MGTLLTLLHGTEHGGRHGGGPSQDDISDNDMFALKELAVTGLSRSSPAAAFLGTHAHIPGCAGAANPPSSSEGLRVQGYAGRGHGTEEGHPPSGESVPHGPPHPLPDSISAA